MNQETFKKIKAKFQDGYFNKIKPNLDKYEKDRLSRIRTCNFIVLPIIAVITALIFMIANSRSNNIEVNLTIATFAILTYFLIRGILEYILEQKIKKEVMPTICSCFDNLEWNCDRYENSNEFHEIGLVDYYNEETFDDKFYGNYNDINFKIIEADLDYVTRRSKNDSRKNIFKGVILKLYLEKDCESHTLIRPDSLFKMPIKNLKRTELEDVIFEKKYDVYTNNEVEARVAITTAFMEKLNNIEKIFDTKKTYVAFYQDKLYIGLHTGKDMFKICSIKEPINNAKYFVKIFEEITSIYQLIDYLKLAKKQ